MTRIDDRLEQDLERAARPAAPDPGATLGEVTRRRARRQVMRKAQTVALVAVVLVGTVAGFAVLQRNFTGAHQSEGTGNASTPSPSMAAPAFAPIAIPSDPTKVFSVDGLSFPVCRGSTIEGNFLGSGPTYAYVFTKASDAGCDTDTTVVAVQVPSDAAGTKTTLAVGGPLDCQDPQTCFVSANPDIDGDGQDEIAIVTAQGASTTSFELYEAQHGSQGWALVPFIDDQGMPKAFVEGATATEAHGAYCDEATGSRRLVRWDATSTDGTSYDVKEFAQKVTQQEGALSMTDLAPTTRTVTVGDLPPSGLEGCGGSIQNGTA